MTRAFKGAGGGKSGSGSGRTPTDSPDTLQSVAYARVLDLVTEGPAVGLENGLQDVFIDGVPLQNPDGSYNFKDVEVTWTDGSQDQNHIPGFSFLESEVNVGVQVKTTTPTVRTIVNNQADQARIRLSVPQLTKLDTSNGDVLGASVEIAIDVQNNGGGYVAQDLHGAGVISGTAHSTYERTFLLDLPKPGPWDIRVRRITSDATTDGKYRLSNETWFQSLTEIVNDKFTMPLSSVVAMKIPSRQFSAIPVRSFLYKGRVIKVPSNYTPASRDRSTGVWTPAVYTGTWDGTFKLAWTNNPAWCFYDYLTSKRYGMGRYIDVNAVNKWALYSIGKYCDEMVSDGYGGQEPRFVCNLYIQDPGEAYKIVTNFASIFRAMTYWSAGTIVVAQDAPQDPSYQFNQTNVVGGNFTHQGTSKRGRHTVAYVAYNDPNNHYKLTQEYVRDEEGVRRYGINVLTMTAFGCSSRGQAHRAGRHALYSERKETDLVTFSTQLEGAYRHPGSVIDVANPRRAGKRYGGRVVSSTTTHTVIDGPGLQLNEPGVSYTLACVINDPTSPDGTVLEKRAITGQSTSSEVPRNAVNEPFTVNGVSAQLAVSGSPIVSGCVVTSASRSDWQGVRFRTNWAKYSTQIDNLAAWNRNGTTVTADVATPPGGTATADKVIANSGSSAPHTVYQAISGITSGTTYTASVKAKAAGYNWFRMTEGNTLSAQAYFNLATGVVGTVSGTGSPSATISPLGDGWYLCSLTYTTATGQVYANMQFGPQDANGGYAFVGDGVSGVYVAEAQYEPGTVATARIATTSAAVTVYETSYYAMSPGARTNMCIASDDLTNAAWVALGTLGVTNATITDVDTTTISSIYQVFTVPDDTSSHTCRVFVGANAPKIVCVEFQRYGGSVPVNYALALNTINGACNQAISAGSMPPVYSVTSGTDAEGNPGWWVSIPNTNNATGNTTLRLRLMPAYASALGGSSTSFDNAATGSAVFRHMKVEPGTVATPHIFTTTAPVTVTDYSATPSGALTLATTGVFTGRQNLSNGTGAATTFPLLVAGAPLPNAAAPVVSALYKTDWQGQQIQYATPRTNLLPGSGTIGGSQWANSNCTVTGTTPAPDGSGTMNLVKASGTGTSYTQSQAMTVAANTELPFSVYFKQGTTPATGLQVSIYNSAVSAQIAGQMVNWSGGVPSLGGVTGTVIGATITDMGNGIYKLSARTNTGSYTSVRMLCYCHLVAEATSTYFWGGMVGATGVYIPTTTTAVTVTDYSLAYSGANSRWEVTYTSAPANGATQAWAGVIQGGPMSGTTFTWNGTGNVVVWSDPNFNTVEHAAFSAAPVPGSVWVITATNLAPQQYRVVTVTQSEKATYTITALQYDPDKYAEIEQGIVLEDAPTTSIPTCLPPQSLTFSEYSQASATGTRTTMVVSWPARYQATEYALEWRKDGGNWCKEGVTASSEISVQNATPGSTYEVRVTANYSGRWSQAVTGAYTVTGKVTPPDDVTGLTMSLTNVGIAQLKWTAVSNKDLDVYEIRYGASWAAGTLIRKVNATAFEWTPPSNASYTVWIKAIDTSGNYSLNATSATLNFNPTTPTSLTATAL